MNNQRNLSIADGIEIKHTGNPVHFKRETMQAEIVFGGQVTSGQSQALENN